MKSLAEKKERKSQQKKEKEKKKRKKEKKKRRCLRLKCHPSRVNQIRTLRPWWPQRDQSPSRRKMGHIHRDLIFYLIFLFCFRVVGIGKEKESAHDIGDDSNWPNVHFFSVSNVSQNLGSWASIKFAKERNQKRKESKINKFDRLTDQRIQGFRRQSSSFPHHSAPLTSQNHWSSHGHSQTGQKEANSQAFEKQRRNFNVILLFCSSHEKSNREKEEKNL